MTTGQKIKIYRKLNKLTQKDLADMVNINHSILSHIEQGWKQPNDEQMERLKKVIDFDSIG